MFIYSLQNVFHIERDKSNIQLNDNRCIDDYELRLTRISHLLYDSGAFFFLLFLDHYIDTRNEILKKKKKLI